MEKLLSDQIEAKKRSKRRKSTTPTQLMDLQISLEPPKLS
jgi:hypothetical protein